MLRRLIILHLGIWKVQPERSILKEMGHQTETGKLTTLDSEYYLCITIWLWCTDVGLVLHYVLLMYLGNLYLSTGQMLTVFDADRGRKAVLTYCFFFFLHNKRWLGSWGVGGIKTCITYSVITFDIYSSGTAQLLTLQAQTGEAKTPGGSRDSSGPLINYVRYPSLLLCSHTHLLTHPQQLLVLCALQYPGNSCQDGKRASTTPCSVLQVCEGGVVQRQTRMPKTKVITAQGSCSKMSLTMGTQYGGPMHREVTSWDLMKG